MKSPLHILHLEDDPSDAALVQTTLQTEGIVCKITLVQTRAEFVEALEHGNIDLILADCCLPAFGGLSAMTLAHASQPELPVILVSGTLGEELAIDSLKNGATDYVLKGRLTRLAPAVRRAMQEVEGRAECSRVSAQLIEAQKMEVMGQLAGGVVHDFNNVLSVIYGYCDWTLSRLPEGDLLHKYVQEIRHAAERAAGLTRQLLVFSRQQAVHPVVLDLNDVVKGLETMLLRLVDENIEMVTAPGDRIGRLKADPVHIGQVLMNLIVNARDAMPNGGRLTIATDNVTLDDRYARMHVGATPGDYVTLSVSDTGVGMTEEVKARLFEAFFTTKPKGKGTGLGLATCRTIVRQAGGHIDVHSAVGKGSTFMVHFPRVEQSLDVVAQPTQLKPLMRGTETVLVVEDEPSVRRLVRGVLRAQGYEVLSAANGQEALNVAREHDGSPIRLVVTDVIMPLMGGKVMAEWLKATYPGLKVLFTSGYTDAAITHDGILDKGFDFLPKPYTPATLTKKVREMLDDESAYSCEMEQGAALHDGPPVTP